MRRIPVSVHGVVELVAGLALLVAAFALDLGTAGTVLLFAGGVALAGVGFGAAESLPLAVHQSVDRALVVALALGSVIAAIDGGELAAGVLLLAAALQLVLMGMTRWTRAPLVGRAR